MLPTRLKQILDVKEREVAKILPKADYLRAAALERNEFRGFAAALDRESTAHARAERLAAELDDARKQAAACKAMRRRWQLHLLQLLQQPPVRHYRHKSTLQHGALLLERGLSIGDCGFQLSQPVWVRALYRQ